MIEKHSIVLFNQINVWRDWAEDQELAFVRAMKTYLKKGCVREWV